MSLSTRLLYCLFAFFLCISCSKSVTDKDLESTPEETRPQEIIEISDFYFESSKNLSLAKDLSFVFADQSSATVELPKYVSKILIPTFKTTAAKVLVNNVEQVSGVTPQNFTTPVKYTFVGAQGTKKEVSISVQWKEFSIPEIAIHIDNGEEVVVKDKYLKAVVKIDGHNLYPDFEAHTEIRGRGNSTWSYAKKPYRLRLTTKSAILGLPAARNWVLLANHLDESLMTNAVAMKIGKDLKVPFTNTTIPVDLTINGTYRGSYLLTEHLEVGADRINISSDGYLLEMDAYFDEAYKFKSAAYNLPVMIKGPELSNQSQVEAIQSDFESMESLVAASSFPTNGYRDKLDIDVFTRYILVYYLTGNEEINHPKSTYMHKKVGGKYSFGPIWDFDWAYGYEGSGRHYVNSNQSLFWSNPKVGTTFFKRLLQDPEVQKAFKNNWENYKKNDLENLLKYVDEYAALIRDSQKRNATKWNLKKSFDSEVSNLKTYLRLRSVYIDNVIRSF